MPNRKLQVAPSKLVLLNYLHNWYNTQMIAIRLSRFGRKNAPFYRIIAVDSTKRQGGTFLEILGTWNPIKKELKIKNEELKIWVGKGAQISAAVKKLLKK